jgi:hypothetical protein
MIWIDFLGNVHIHKVGGALFQAPVYCAKLLQKIKQKKIKIKLQQYKFLHPNPNPNPLYDKSVCICLPLTSSPIVD